jgi:hypothetical protein
VTEEAKARLQDMFGQVDSLSDPQEQIVRFFNAIWQGMPSTEAAEYFLHLDSAQFESFKSANAYTARLIIDFEGRVALEQYRKLTKDGTPREALEWLKANRPGLWRTKQEVDIKNVGTDQLIALLAIADQSGAS